MDRVSRNGLSGSFLKGQQIGWFEAVRFLDWYCKQGNYGSWTTTSENVASGIPTTVSFVYAVRIQGDAISYSQSSVDEATARRRAELGAAICVLSREPEMRVRWAKEKESVVKQGKAKEKAKENEKKRSLNQEDVRNVGAHPQPSATPHKEPHPEVKQVKELVSKLIRDFKQEMAVSTSDSLELTKSERDVFKQECEQLRAEVKELKEEQERTRNEGCQNCQCSTPEPSLSSTESSLLPLAEIGFSRGGFATTTPFAI